MRTHIKFHYPEPVRLCAKFTPNSIQLYIRLHSTWFKVGFPLGFVSTL